MVLKANRKNVAKIVAAISFPVVSSFSLTCQLNGVEDEILIPENVRDGLQSNIRILAKAKNFMAKNFIAPFVNNIVAPVMNKGQQVMNCRAVSAPLSLLYSAFDSARKPLLTLLGKKEPLKLVVDEDSDMEE